MVACPMIGPGTAPHVGGPIIPPCQVNVIVCGMPQARVTDKSLCATAIPAKIVTGAWNVLVGGQPAARIGDKTSHGGTIITGCPTVLIGTDGGSVNVALAPAEISPICAKLADAVDLAMLSDHVYSKGVDAEKDPPKELPPGYREARPDELKKLGLKANDITPELSQFRANVYVKEKPTGPDEFVIAMKGTTSRADWMQNIANGIGQESDYYRRAIYIGNKVRKVAKGLNIRFTGHSLGGGLASAASIAANSEATTFNAAGFAPGPSSPDAVRIARPEKVKAYFVGGELLSTAQDNRMETMSFLLNTINSISPALAVELGCLLALQELRGKPVLSPAFGTRIKLDAIAPAKISELSFVDQLDKHLLNSSIGKHLMPWVLSSLKAKQRKNGCPKYPPQEDDLFH